MELEKAIYEIYAKLKKKEKMEIRPTTIMMLCTLTL